MKAANSCDKCGRERATLYEQSGQLACYYCLPDEALSGRGALRAIRAAVTGLMNIEQRRNALRRRTKG